MQYIVSLSEPYAIPNDDDAFDYILDLAGYDSLDELAEDMDDPRYSTMTAPELADELHGATLEDELDGDTYVDCDGNVATYEEIEDATADTLTDVYGEVEVAGSVFDAGRVLAEMDPVSFRCEVLGFIDSDYFESWSEWHNAVA